MIQRHRHAVEEPPRDVRDDPAEAVNPLRCNQVGVRHRRGKHPLVALISSTTEVIAATEAAFGELFAAAAVWNVVDDGLPSRGAITIDMHMRMRRLVDHAVYEGAEAVLVTCPAYAAVARQAAAVAPVPVIAAEGAVLDVVAGADFRRVVVLLPTTDGMDSWLARIASVASPDAVIEGAVVEGSADAGHDAGGVVEAITKAVSPVAPAPDAIILGHHSLSVGTGAVQARLGIPTLSGPQCAARRLRTLLMEDAS